MFVYQRKSISILVSTDSTMTRETIFSKELKVLATEKTNGSTTINGDAVIIDSLTVAVHSPNLVSTW
jgi:hypothetical protein